MKQLSFYFTDDVEAYEDVWITRDVFVKDTANALVALRQAVKINKKLQTPYLYQHFNVIPYHNTNSAAMRGIARQINPLIEALNE